MNKNDILEFSRKENITLSNGELEYVYTTIKSRYSDILNNKFDIESIKDNLSYINYLKIKDLYYKYKDYYM